MTLADQAHVRLLTLIIEDDEFMQEVVAELAETAWDTDVIAVRDGHAALAVLDELEHQPDVVLCDLAMEGMDGIELLRHLAQRGFPGAVGVMSGIDDELLHAVGDLVVAHGLDLFAVLPKPISMELLRESYGGLTEERIRNRVPRALERYAEELLPEQILQGVRAGCVRIFVQPKVTVGERRVVGAEALLRWQDAEQGVIPPSAIIPVAERHGLMEELTIAVYREAVNALAAWRDAGVDISISVNLSTDNLISLGLPDLLADIAAAAGIDTRRIVLEITESGLMRNLAVSLEVIGRLRLKNFRLSIDDYGTGYSNLTKLQQLPITELKVDRSFVHTADRNPVLHTILSSSTALGHSLNLSVVAEGVETPEVWSVLEALGCDEVQGYLVAKPMPVDTFVDWKHSWDATWAVPA